MPQSWSSQCALSKSCSLLCILTCVLLQLFEAVAVCRAWRRAGKRLFFAQPWDACTTICHPLQLFSLVTPAPNTLLRVLWSWL